MPDDRVTISARNRGGKIIYPNLWLMTLFDHSIIANSAFSWWGVSLYSNKLKAVFLLISRGMMETVVGVLMV